jgi:acyl-CoA reductase-like NAD-dependent aldehyde dehydrogenase
MNEHAQVKRAPKPTKKSTGGGTIQAEPPSVIVCRNPATGDLLGEVPVMDPDEVRARLGRARQAQAAWATTSFAERRRVLGRLLELVLAKADQICRNISLESGKTLQNAMMGEIWPVCEKLRWTIREGERHLRPERVSSGLLVHKVATIEYLPLGVVGVICPWNFPFQNILGPTIPALMAGNAVLCKVSEWSSYSAPLVQSWLSEIFSSMGHSADLVQILTGYGETGAALVRSGVDKVFFTGSVGNGRRVVDGSVENLTPVVLELGGKDPLIVCDDADIDQAVAGALAGVFISSGQMCLAAERIYVFDAVYDRFVAEVTAAVRGMRQGAPLAGSGSDIDIGAMTMPQQVELVDRLVQDALAKGARALVGGDRTLAPATGQFYPPTVLVDVDHTMTVMREETFGPVMAIMRVHSEAEAIRLSNDSVFGLGSTVFSKDQARAVRIASQIRAGATCINDYGLAYMANDLPFGGVGHSGFGRLQGREGLRSCTNIKALVTDRLPFLHVPSRIYPVRPGDYEMVKSAVDLIYQPLSWAGIKARAGAVASITRQIAARMTSA